jgi:hypothetical protein
VQVKLVNYKTKFNTCDDDLPHFVMLLGVMLMVKIGISDHQQKALMTGSDGLTDTYITCLIRGIASEEGLAAVHHLQVGEGVGGA